MLLLLGSALAADVVTQGELSSRARDLARLNMGGVVLVAETEADRALVDARMADGVLPRFTVVTASSADPAAAALDAATRTGTRCALLMSSPVQSMWKVAAYGECAAVFAETAMALPPPGTPPTGGANPVPTWPSGAEPKATPAPATTPTPATTPPPVAPAPAPIPQGATPENLRRYKMRRLVRGPLNYAVGGGSYVAVPGVAATALPAVTVTSWAVYDGGGAPFSAPEFARVTGDRATSVRLDHERLQARNTALGAAIGSGAFAATAVAAFAALRPLPSFEGSADAIAGEDEYRRIQSANGAWTAVGVLSTLSSITTLTVAAAAMPALNARHRSVDRQYSTAEADNWIEKHNAGLREELGLSELDVQQIDLLSRQPAPNLQLAVAPGALALSATF